MKAVELCYILKRNYKEGKFQCNMDSCSDKPCDLCTVEKFEKEVKTEAIKNFAEWLVKNMFNGCDEFWNGNTPNNKPLHMKDFITKYESELKNDL